MTIGEHLSEPVAVDPRHNTSRVLAMKCRQSVWTDLRQWRVALLQIAVLRHGVRALLCLETEQSDVCFGSPV